MTQTTTMDRKATASPPSKQNPDLVDVAPNLPAGLPKGLRNYWYPVMWSRDLRRKAVPELVRFSQDPALDATTRKWVFQALREITLQNLADDPARWASWYGAQANRN